MDEGSKRLSNNFIEKEELAGVIGLGGAQGTEIGTSA